MEVRVGFDAEVARIARQQHGVISHDQLVTLGGGPDLARRRVDQGRWVRRGRGVFVVAGTPATYEQGVAVALAAAGDGAVASHRTAARLWGLTTTWADVIEITVPRSRFHRASGVIVHRARDLHRARPVRRSGLPVTGAARTVLDLGAVAPTSVRRAVWAGLRNRSVSWPTLLDVVVDHAQRGRAGVGPLREVLAEHYGERATDSTTEDLAYEVLVDSGRVPVPQKQVPVTCADGVEVTIDLGWPEWNGLLEVFGVDHLTNEDLQHLDLHRRNQIELTGRRLLVYTGRLVERQPDQLVADVDAMLRAGGWPGPDSGAI